MTSTFGILLQVSTTLHASSSQHFLQVLKLLFEKNENHKSRIISAIFGNFYNDPKSIDSQLLEDLLNISKIQTKQQESRNHFESLPDGLLCNIASYLPGKDVFCKLNHVNHRFIQIGLKPESITKFEFDSSDCKKIEANLPKFKIDSTLSKLCSIHSCTSIDKYQLQDEKHETPMKYLLGGLSIKHAKSLSLGTYSYVSCLYNFDLEYAHNL